MLCWKIIMFTERSLTDQTRMAARVRKMVARLASSLQLPEDRPLPSKYENFEGPNSSNRALRAASSA